MTKRDVNGFALSPPETVPRVRVTVMYEDLEAAFRAKALMSSVVSRLEAPAEFELGFWNFDSFDDLSGRANSAYDAEDSGVVVVSAQSADRLPEDLEGWFEDWLPFRDGDPSAFVLLLAEGSEELLKPNSLPSRLQHAAEREGVVFYCEFWQPEFTTRAHPTRRDLTHGTGSLHAVRRLLEDGCLIPGGVAG